MELLLSTNYSNEVIAEKSGFQGTSYFYRIFKKSAKKTPRQYRKFFQ